MDAQLAECITASVDPTVSAGQRRLAQEAFDGFKENLSSIDVALSLCRSHGSSHVRHGALVLLEHWVRVHWDALSDEQRSHLKSEVFFYMGNVKSIFEEPAHVKQAICRVVVEMVKRDWPQKWPHFMSDLLSLAAAGMAQTEIVLFVLLRIVEDVVQFHTLDEAPRRRKNIYQSLLSSLPAIMSFLFNTMNAYCYNVPQPSEELLRSRVKLLRSLLTTLASFVEFVMFKDFPLTDVIRMLCVLLNDSDLRVPAARCLCELSERKFRGSELEQLCEKFLQPEVMSEILRSAAVSTNVDTSQNREFLLVLCETIAGISKQVSLHILEVPKFECSQSFVELVMAVNGLCQHPCCVVARVALGAMTSLVRIEQKNPEKLVYPEQLWQDIAVMIVNRLSFNDFCQSNWDFEEVAELRRSHAMFKTELTELLRVATSVQPAIVISQVGLARLSEVFQKAPDEQDWAVMSRYFDVVCSTVVRENVNVDGLVPQIMAAYDRVLPLRLLPGEIGCQSHAISLCSSILTVIVDKDGDHSRLGQMLDTVFWVVNFERPGENRSTRSVDVRDFRKHGTALLVRLSLDFQQPLMRYFDKIAGLAMRSLRSEATSTLERQHFIEALTALSNGLKDPAGQASLLEQVLSDEVAFFGEEGALKGALTDAQRFISYLGLLSVEDFERNSEHRVLLNGRLAAVTGALKRCKVFEGRHVVFEIIARTCLNRILKVLWLFKELFAQSNVHPDLVQSILCLGENDKFSIFGSNLPSCEFPRARVPAAQAFMTNLQDALTSFFVAISYRAEFYSLRPDMGSIITHGIQNLPNYKMHFYLHLIVKSFVKNCPEPLLLPQLSSTFIPIMSMMFGYLEGKWRSQRNLCRGDETEATLDQLLSDHVTHHMSRDLVEIASYFVIDSSGQPVKASDEAGAESVPAVKSFGVQLLADESTRGCVVTIAFSALYATDSQTSFKAIPLCSAIALHMVQQRQVTEELCVLIYQSLLLSLRVHGDNEALLPLLLTLGIHLYKWLAVCAGARIREMLLAAGVQQQQLAKFEATLAPDVTIAARKRKDIFRATVEHLLGSAVSTMGKQAQIKDQGEPLWRMPRPKVELEDFCLDVLGF